MPDPVSFPITLPFMAAKDVGDGPGVGRGRGGSPEPDDEDGDQGPEVAPAGAYPDPGGYYESNIFGQRIWHSTNGGPDLYGDEAEAEFAKHSDGSTPDGAAAIQKFGAGGGTGPAGGRPGTGTGR